MNKSSHSHETKTHTRGVCGLRTDFKPNLVLVEPTHVMEGLESLTGVQHSQNEPEQRLRQLAGGQTALETMEKNTANKRTPQHQISTAPHHSRVEQNQGGADLSAHISTCHVGEDGLQHDLHRRSLLAEGGEDGEEPVSHRDSIQTSMEVLMFGEVETTGP